MTTWRPQIPPVRTLLLIAPVLCLVLATWLWSLLRQRVQAVNYDPGVFWLGVALFLTLVLAGMLSYVAWCALSILYSTDGKVLLIRGGGFRHVVPLSAVSRVYSPGEAIGTQSLQVKWRGAAGVLPGYVVGEGTSPQLGRVISTSTVQPPGQVFVVTDQVTFGLSPREGLKFVEQIRRQMGQSLEAEEGPRTELVGPGRWAAGLWSDRLARWLLLGGLVLCALLFFYMSLVYGDLPSHLPLHWNAQAQVDRIGDPTELLRLPGFALLVWLANAVAGWWALRRERAATLFLLAGAAAAQIVFAAGALSIVLKNS